MKIESSNWSSSKVPGRSREFGSTVRNFFRGEGGRGGILTFSLAKNTILIFGYKKRKSVKKKVIIDLNHLKYSSLPHLFNSKKLFIFLETNIHNQQITNGRIEKQKGQTDELVWQTYKIKGDALTCLDFEIYLTWDL